MAPRTRENLPYNLIVASFLADGLFALGKTIAPGTIGSDWPQRVGGIVAGGLLSMAILFGLVSAIQGEHRRRNGAAMAIAVILQIGWTGFFLWAATSRMTVAQARRAGVDPGCDDLCLANAIARGATG